MNKNISIGCAVCVVILGAAAFLFVSMTPPLSDMSATPEQAFAVLCKLEMPKTITNIECHGAFWMDHNFSIKFNASDSDIEQILGAGYSVIGWGKIERMFKNPPYIDDFEGRWQPGDIDTKSCYTLSSTSKDYDEEHFLVIDHDVNLVYCVSSGSVK